MTTQTQTFATSLVALNPAYQMESALEFAEHVRTATPTRNRARVHASTAPAPAPGGPPVTCPSCGYCAPVTPGAKTPLTCPKCAAIFTPGNAAPVPAAESLAASIRKQRSACNPLNVATTERVRRLACLQVR